MNLNLQELNAAVIARAAVDLRGEPLRGLLGEGAASIIDASDLKAEDLPAMPIIALRRGPAPKRERIIRQPLYTWYVFDEPVQASWRIEAVLAALAALYDPACGGALLELEQGVIANVETDIGPTYTDQLLGLPASWIRLAITASA